MARRGKYGQLLLFQSTETTLVSLCYSETIKFKGTQRQIWSFALFSIDRYYFSLSFVYQRRASLLTRRDKYGHLLLWSKTHFLSTETTLVSHSSSRDKQVQWHAKTVMVTRFRCSETIKVPFAIQRQLSLMVSQPALRQGRAKRPLEWA